jgi:DNA ligase-1
MRIVKESPVLVSKTRTGKNKYWQVLIVEVNGVFFTQTKYWQDTADGVSKEQYSSPIMAQPTNVGRANERGNEEQAYFEFDAMLKKQSDKGYTGEGVTCESLPLPMLANKWNEKKHTVTFPVALQPKLDGVRMLMKDGVCWSRTGKEIIPEVVAHIACNTDGLTLDGELIYEGASFQDTMRAVKKFRPEMSPKLTYHVFDVVMPDFYFVNRYDVLNNFMVNNHPNNVELVPCQWDISSEEELQKYHAEYIQAGYEGTIVRTLSGRYQIGQRSSDLLKLKDFDDAEFVVADVKEGEGRDSGAAIFICKVNDGDMFAVRPKGTMDYRREVWENKEDYLGKKLTVRYQGFSEEGIPRFPIGISIRDSDIQG